MFKLGGSDGEDDDEQTVQPQTIDALRRIRFHHAGKHTRLGNDMLKRVERGESAAAILEQWSEVRHHFKACLDANDDMMQAPPTTDVEYQAGAAWGEARTVKHRAYEEVVIAYTGVMRGDLSGDCRGGGGSARRRNG